MSPLTLSNLCLRRPSVKTLELLSVGIDIGTTTTQVIFSRLSLVNRASISQVPRYEFVKREIIWQSPVLFTPVDLPVFCGKKSCWLWCSPSIRPQALRPKP